MVGIPTCVHQPNLKKFLVTHNVGKAFTSGGFGVVLPRSYRLDPDQDPERGHGLRSSRPPANLTSNTVTDTNFSLNEAAPKDDGIVSGPPAEAPTSRHIDSDTSKPSNASAVTMDTSNAHLNNNIYLFLEEALYLHERGLLRVMEEQEGKDDGTQEGGSNLNEASQTKRALVPMDSVRLFSLLEEYDIPLPIYLTYAYLRAQTFIVLRHFDRSSLPVTDDDGEDGKIDGDMDIDVNGDDNCNSSAPTVTTNPTPPAEASVTDDGVKDDEETKQKKILKIQRIRERRELMRKMAFDATVPVVLDDTITSDGDGVAFDVYQPNTKFVRSDPGPPDLLVAVARFDSPSPPFHVLQNLLVTSNPGTTQKDDSGKTVKANANITHTTLKLALVAETGTVLMFGMAHGDVPSLIQNDG